MNDPSASARVQLTGLARGAAGTVLAAVGISAASLGLAIVAGGIIARVLGAV